jgi:hypothetical protein
MTRESEDPHEIESELIGEEEYQAPPREQGGMAGDDADAADPSEDQADDPPIDINLLEAQRQRPGLQISETIVVDPSKKEEYTVSGPDERTQPGGPRAVPPGESM